MDLRQRLARLDRLTSRPQPLPVAGPGGGMEALVADLGLREESTPAGPCWVREWREAAPMGDDRVPDLSGLLSRHGDRRPARTEVLFVDTETTGLAGGTGTLAFLVGVGWFEGPEFVVRQLFLPGPGREGGLLCALQAWAEPFAVVVTYNGAAFDLPLLRTRALMNRRGDPLDGLLSWDLLPACRRLWGRAVADCRQQTIEDAVCGLARGPGDIEGARIPEVWRGWLAGEPSDDLACVLRHNRRDLAGMAHILARVAAEGAAVATPPAADEPCGDLHAWRRAWALARVAERRRDTVAGAGWVLAAMSAGALRDAGTQLLPFCADAARLLKRRRRWAEVEMVLQAALAAGGGRWFHREAAILYEHRLRRLDLALIHAASAGDAARLERLQRRLALGPEA